MLNDEFEFDETVYEETKNAEESISALDELIRAFENSSGVKEIIENCSSSFLFLPISTVMARHMLKLYAEEFTKTHLLWMLALNINYQINNVCVTVSKDNLAKLIQNHYLENSQNSADEEESLQKKVTSFVDIFAGGADSDAIAGSLLSSSRIVGTSCEDQTPFVLFRGTEGSAPKLYFRRIFAYEQGISSFIRNNSKLSDNQDIGEMNKVLDLLFPDSATASLNWKKVAVASSALSAFSVICGGPGTGKTTTVFLLLILLCALNKEGRTRIMLAAPTGKAATRMVESITSQLQEPKKKEPGRKTPYELLKDVEKYAGFDIEGQIPRTATTVHSLIKRIPHRESPVYAKDNPLPCDILVIDEISMISVDLFSKLLGALGNKTRLIMLGDKDQLCSVEPGKVMADICSVLDEKITPDRQKVKLISQLTGYSADSLLSIKGYRYISSDYVSTLIESFRFRNDSKLKAFAGAVNEAETLADTKKLLNGDSCSYIPFSDILKNKDHSLFASSDPDNSHNTFTSNNEVEVTVDTIDSGNDRDLVAVSERLADETVSFYLRAGKDMDREDTEENKENNKDNEFLSYLKEINFEISSDDEAKKAFSLLNRFRVLCANRNGILGTENLNRIICNKVKDRLDLTDSAADDLFLGKVILINKNNRQLGVDNGDVGFVAISCDANEERKKRVFFPPREGSAFRKISPERLSDFESGFAMTIHKSQGSEYQNVCMVLGSKSNRVITKELIYTGLTRAKLIKGEENTPDQGGKVCIVTSRKVLEEGIIRRTERESGLSEMLRK